jgi:hypothetical protein
VLVIRALQSKHPVYFRFGLAKLWRSVLAGQHMNCMPAVLEPLDDVIRQLLPAADLKWRIVVGDHQDSHIRAACSTSAFAATAQQERCPGGIDTALFRG